MTQQQPKIRVTDTQTFIKKSKQIHGNTYLYHKVKYKSSHEKVIITCLKHGDFEQRANGHLNGKGCPQCAIELHGKDRLKSQIDFENQANKVHNNFYDYSKSIYCGNKKPIIITCPAHGDFKQRPQVHLKGVGCKKCADLKKRLTFDEFEKRANIFHKNKYRYIPAILKGNMTKIKIICPIHGEFTQTAMRHLQGGGCQKCGLELKGWTKTDFAKFCDKWNDGNGFLYVLKCFGNNEQFYKIGITSKRIQMRFDCKKSMPYKYDVFAIIEKSSSEIYDLETKIHRELAKYRYKPKISFQGKTECFSDISSINDMLDDFINNNPAE